MGAPQYEQAGADVAGSGTTNTIPRWTGATTLGDSGLIDNGTAIYTTTRNVGVGTASPTGRLHVVGGTAAASTNGAPVTIIAQSAGSGAAQNGGNIVLTPGSKTGTGTDGVVDLSSPSGTGLKLPAAPGAADTQTLDCYQENTWTPTLTAFDGTAPTVTTAKYTRIGRVVYFEVVLIATGAANFGSTWGNTKVSLPFAPANTIAIPINRNAIGSCGTTSGSDILLTTYAQNAETMRLTGFFSV